MNDQFSSDPPNFAKVYKELLDRLIIKSKAYLGRSRLVFHQLVNLSHRNQMKLNCAL